MSFMHTTRFDRAYADLVQAWERHHHLRRRGASFAELIDSRRLLDERRLAAARVRRDVV